MNTINRKLINGLGIAVVALILSFGITYVIAANSWVGPSCNPPNCNTDAPINTGSDHQIKVGSLTLNTNTTNPDVYGLDVFGKSRFFGNIEIGSVTTSATIKIIDGNQHDGYVLTSDANGLASWRVPSGGGSTGTVTDVDMSGWKHAVYSRSTCDNSNPKVCTYKKVTSDTEYVDDAAMCPPKATMIGMDIASGPRIGVLCAAPLASYLPATFTSNSLSINFPND